MVEDSIVRETEIAAPPERVWEVLTRAAYVGRWFGADTAEIDLRPGGSFVLICAERDRAGLVGGSGAHAVQLPVGVGARVEPKPGEETLAEFTLAPRATARC